MGEKTRLVETPKGVLMNPELGGDALPLAYDERAAVERDDEERQQLPTSQHHVPERAQTERNSPGHCGQHVKLTVFVYLNTHAWHSKALYLRRSARRNRMLCQRLTTEASSGPSLCFYSPECVERGILRSSALRRPRKFASH